MSKDNYHYQITSQGELIPLRSETMQLDYRREATIVSYDKIVHWFMAYVRDVIKKRKGKYDHLYALAFTALSDGEAEATPEEIRIGLLRRLRQVHMMSDRELLEAVGLPEETIDNEE